MEDEEEGGEGNPMTLTRMRMKQKTRMICGGRNSRGESKRLTTSRALNSCNCRVSGLCYFETLSVNKNASLKLKL